MKLIQATWEERNLGVTCHEFVVEALDARDDVESAVMDCQSAYQVLKLPCDRSDLVFSVQAWGFNFVETLIKCHFEGPLPRLSGLQQRYYNSLVCTQASQAEFEIILEAVRDTPMFLTDRVALDPQFGPIASAKRYHGWLGDEWERGALFFLVRKEENPVGFFVSSPNGIEEVSAVIAGVFERYQGRGMGYFLHYFQIQNAFASGAKILRGSYSLNNRMAHGLHRSFGYLVDEEFYVFVRRV